MITITIYLFIIVLMLQLQLLLPLLLLLLLLPLLLLIFILFIYLTVSKIIVKNQIATSINPKQGARCSSVVYNRKIKCVECIVK